MEAMLSDGNEGGDGTKVVCVCACEKGRGWVGDQINHQFGPLLRVNVASRLYGLLIRPLTESSYWHAQYNLSRLVMGGGCPYIDAGKQLHAVAFTGVCIVASDTPEKRMSNALGFVLAVLCVSMLLTVGHCFDEGRGMDLSCSLGDIFMLNARYRSVWLNIFRI